MKKKLTRIKKTKIKTKYKSWKWWNWIKSLCWSLKEVSVWVIFLPGKPVFHYVTEKSHKIYLCEFLIVCFAYQNYWLRKLTLSIYWEWMLLPSWSSWAHKRLVNELECQLNNLQARNVMIKKAGLLGIMLFSAQKDIWNLDYTQKFCVLKIREMAMRGMKGSANRVWRCPGPALLLTHGRQG